MAVDVSIVIIQEIMIGIFSRNKIIEKNLAGIRCVHCEVLGCGGEQFWNVLHCRKGDSRHNDNIMLVSVGAVR